MTGLVAPQQRGRRFVITMGAGSFSNLPPEAALPRVEDDMQRIASMFSGFGYTHALPGFTKYASLDHVRTALGQWARDVHLTDEDVTVVYFAGHGIVEERDRHYLLCWNSDDRRPAETALATGDLVRVLVGNGSRNLLLILDTCYGAAGGADGASIVLQTVARSIGSDRVATGLWFLSSARARDEAADGAFVDVLPAAIESVAARSGQRQRYIDLADLVGEVNRAFEDGGLGQRAELAGGFVSGLPPFVPNPGFHEQLPPQGTDLEVQGRVAARYADIDITEHFGPRSRGVEFESEQGMYFSGRRKVLMRLVDWLTAPGGGGRGVVVTGSPGCGKSAVLGRIVAMSSPGYRATINPADLEPGTVVPENTVHVAVHARHKRLEEVVARFAADLGIQADSPTTLLYELSRRDRDLPPVVAVVDALDEAGSGTAADTGGSGEPRRIARDLLRPMAQIPAVKLLVGTRRELVGPLGAGLELIDLDTPLYAADEDVAGYVSRVLLAADEADVKTPYRDNLLLARQVGQAVAQRASGVYLVARMAARGLRDEPKTVDTAEPGWIGRLPGGIGEAFDDYLARFDADEARVRRLLTPLAVAEGQGLPRGEVWSVLATALSGVPTGDADIAWVLKAAGSYVAEVTDQGRSVYRLYHQSLAEHLRRDPTIDPVTAQTRIVDALLSLVPSGPRGTGCDWFSAPSYVHANLPTHAVAAGRLSELIADPGFLLVSEQSALLRALATAEPGEEQRVRNAYEQVAHHIADRRPLGERAAYLQMSAHRCGATRLARAIDGIGVALPWSTRWAWWSPTGVHRQLRGHTRDLNTVAIGELDGRPIALTGGSDGTARIWDLVTQRPLGVPMGGHEDVTAVAFGEVGDYTLALTGGTDGLVRVFDLSTGREHGEPLSGHTNQITAMALGRLGDIDVCVTASEDGTARVWDLATRRQSGPPFALHRSAVRAVALGAVDGRIVALTGGEDSRGRIWDVRTGEQLGAGLIGHTGAVTAVALTRLDGVDVAVTGSDDGTVGLWDLATRHQIGEPLQVHPHPYDRGVKAVAVGRLAEDPVLLTCSIRDARLWNLRTRHRIGQPLAGHASGVSAAVLGTVNGRPTAVTAGWDRTARIWDLAAENPTAGHTGNIVAVDTYDAADRPLAVTGGTDNTARIWDLRERRQLGHALEGHSGPVGAVAIGKCGDRIVAVTAGTDTTVRLWDCETLQPCGEPLIGHTNAVTAVGLGDYGGAPMVVSGGRDGTVRLWDPMTGRELTGPLSGHHGSVERIALGVVDGTPVLVVGAEGGVYVWSLERDGAPPRMSGKFDSAEALAMAQIGEVAVIDGRPVAILIAFDNSVRFFDAMTGHEIRNRLIGHTQRIYFVRYCVAGGRPSIATAAQDNTLRFWDAADGTQIGSELPVQPDCLATFSNNTVVCDGEVMRIWDLTTSRPVGEPVSGLDATARNVDIGDVDGKRVVVAGGTYTVRFHDADSGRPMFPELVTSRSFVMTGVLPQCSRLTVVGGQYDGDVTIWDASSGRRIETLSGSNSPVNAFAAVTVAGRDFLISADDDAKVRVWGRETWQPEGEPLTGHTATVESLVATQMGDGGIAASCGSDGSIRLWDIPTGERLADPLVSQDASFSALAIGVVDGRKLLVSGDVQGGVHVWDLESRRSAGALIAADDEGITALWSGTLDGRSVVVAGDATGRIRVIGLDDRLLLKEIGLEVAINDLAVDPSGQLSVACRLGVITLDLLGGGKRA